MPILSRSLHGVTAGCAPSKTSGTLSVKRSAIGGWSQDACRRNVRFLRTVRQQDLTGDGYSLTLTIGECPQTHEDWHRLLKAYFKRLERLGMIRLHWVIEWQRRGVPHLHACAYFPHVARSQVEQHNFEKLLIWEHWMRAGAIEYNSDLRAQYCLRVYDAVGWFQYVSKHAARGISHYQRSPECQPKHWEKTGRMWGKRGDWPTDTPQRYDLDNRGFWAFRRIVRAWRKADARSSGTPSRIRSARRMLRCTHSGKSPVRGVSEWIPADLQTTIIEHLAATGHHVQPAEVAPGRMLAPRPSDPKTRQHTAAARAHAAS